MGEMIKIFAAFGGGIVASAVGGVEAFVFCGIVGLAAVLSNHGLMLDNCAFGPIFVPCVGFASAVAATAFCSNKRKKLDSGTAITAPLAGLNDPYSLLVGGLFGALGYSLMLAAGALGINCDIPALIVLVLNMAVRLIFGKTGLTGIHPKDGSRRYLITGKQLADSVVLGLGFGLMAAFIAKITNQPLIPFCISAIFLGFLCCNVNVPGTHHITIVAAYAAVATGSMAAGTVAGVLASVLGTQLENIFNQYNDTHIDSPAFTIAVGSFIIFNFIH